jgi:hypothetical protein
MEVVMLKAKRYTPYVDCLECKVLLSHGLGDPATSVHQDVVRHVRLGGVLGGLPWGTASSDGYQVLSFLVQGRAGSMAKVSGSVNLADTFVPAGKLPDLSDASLLLANRKGSVNLAIATSKTNRYTFKVVDGSGAYISAFGSGTVTIKASPNPSSLAFVIKLHTTGAE